jgi:hypothetical protein
MSGDDRGRSTEDSSVLQTEWKSIYERVRWLVDVKFKGVNQRELCERAGLSSGYVGAYFTRVADARRAGKADATLNADALAGICVGWGVSPAWLLLGIGTPDDQAPAVPSAQAVSTFADAPSWRHTVTTAKALEPSLPEWAYGVVGAWPSPPSGVAFSAGLVIELARVVTRFYPSPAEEVPDQSETRVKPFAPTTAAGGSRR